MSVEMVIDGSSVLMASTVEIADVLHESSHATYPATTGLGSGPVSPARD